MSLVGAGPASLTVARDLSRVTERLGLYDEYVQLGEMCADAISSYDPLAAAARFRHFAEVLRDRLDQVERAAVMLEKSLALFERGVTLSRYCHEQLGAAQRRIEQLTERGELKDASDLIGAGNDR